MSFCGTGCTAAHMSLIAVHGLPANNQPREAQTTPADWATELLEKTADKPLEAKAKRGIDGINGGINGRSRRLFYGSKAGC